MHQGLKGFKLTARFSAAGDFNTGKDSRNERKHEIAILYPPHAIWRIGALEQEYLRMLGIARTKNLSMNMD